MEQQLNTSDMNDGSRKRFKTEQADNFDATSHQLLHNNNDASGLDSNVPNQNNGINDNNNINNKNNVINNTNINNSNNMNSSTSSQNDALAAGKNNSSANQNNQQQQQDTPTRSKRVYVANIPFDVKWAELKDFFREKVGNVSYCTIFENEDGKSRGCGLLEFQDPASARRAIEVMHRSEFKKRELVVKEDLDCERDRFGRIITNHGANRQRDDSQRRDGNAGNNNSNNNSSNNNNDRQERGGGGAGGGRGDRGRQMHQQLQQQQHHHQQHQQQQQQQQQHQVQQQQHNNNDSYGYDHSVMSNAYGKSQHHNTFGLSQQFLDSLGIGLPLNNRIFVANLEYKVDQNKLEEIFKLAGKVARVKLSHDSQGLSRGYGTVEYEHPVEAVQAISMFHNQKLYGRTMSVRMDKYECEDDIDALPSKLPTGLESIGKGLGVGGQPLNIAKSIMNAALIAPPHLTPPGPQPIPQMHQPVQPPAAMQQAVIAAQMQQLQQQQQQQQQQQHPHQHAHAHPHQAQQQPQQQQQQPLQQQPHSLPHAIPAVAQQMQQTLPPTMQHQLQQQFQMHQLTQPTPQPTLQSQGVPPPMAGVQAYPTLQQMQQAGGVRAQPTANVYQQQPPQQAQQPQVAAQQAPQQAAPTPVSSLSVYSTFERQFREASAPQNFTRN